MVILMNELSFGLLPSIVKHSLWLYLSVWPNVEVFVGQIFQTLPKKSFIKVTCFKIFQKSIITWATIVQKLGAKNFKKSPTFWSHWHYRWGWPGSNEDIQFKALLRWTQAEMSFRPLPTYGDTQNSLSNLFQWAMPGIFFFIFVFSLHLPISKCSI